MWQWTQRLEDGKIVDVNTLRDRNSNGVVTQGRLYTGGTGTTPDAYAPVLQLVIQNEGRSAASDIRIPITVMGFGRPSLRWSPNIDLLVDSLEAGTSRRIDVLKIRSLPPQTAAVITYRFDLDSVATYNIQRHPLPVRPKVVSVTADNASNVRLPSDPAPLGIVSAFEAVLNPQGSEWGIFRNDGSADPNRDGEWMRTVLQFIDPWIRATDSMKAVNDIEDATAFAEYLRDRYSH